MPPGPMPAGPALRPGAQARRSGPALVPFRSAGRSTPMTAPIRVGIIGANPTRGWALGTHLPALEALPGFELVAVATRHEASARSTADRFGVRLWFADPARLIAHDDVDVVTV